MYPQAALPTFDFHQHLWPEQLVAALARRGQPPRLSGSRLELSEGVFDVDLDAHRLERRLAELDRDGIEVAVVSLAPTLGDPLPDEIAEAYHEGIVEVAARSAGRVRALAAGVALDGFAGACVPAGALLDLEAPAPLLDELERRRQPLFVHPGPGRPPAGAPSWWAPCVDYTAQMQAAHASWLAAGAARWLRLPVVFAILVGGAPFQLERLASRGLDVRDALSANVYFDTASYGVRAVELCLATYGVGRLVYGSDSPLIDPAPTLQAVRSFGQSVAVALCSDNPARLLG